MTRPSQGWAVVLLTAAALCSFAANSLLCRLALRGGSIDPVAFTVVRLVSGAALLGVVAGKGTWRSGDWVSGAMLWLYAAAFSFAYLGLGAGTGALLLFGAVQVTMIGVGLFRREHPTVRVWAGLAVGMGGLVWLLSPGLSAPPAVSAVLMVVAGGAWGVYSLRGRGSGDPVRTTAANFMRAAVLAVPLLLARGRSGVPDSTGLALAAVSGAVTSGLGYVAWYAAIRHLKAVHAAIVQLCVPVLAAFAGVAFLGEELTLRLTLASALVIGGVALALPWRQGRLPPRDPPEG